MNSAGFGGWTLELLKTKTKATKQSYVVPECTLGFLF